MSLKTIQLTISNTDFPIDVSGYTPEENTFLLKMGIKCLEESKKYALSLSQEEIYEKIKQESRQEIEVLENTILIEKGMVKKAEEYTKQMYQNQIDRLETRVETLLKQIKGYECENDAKMQIEIKRIQDKCELLLLEKDKQNQLNRESFEKAIHLQKYKSMKERGTDGEDEFADLAETFQDFPGYRIENMSKQGHKGDFHLFFEDFNVLVDLKKYTVNVNKKEIDKIEMDLQTNEHMNYAWLISLNSDIHGWNRFPIMYKWIMSVKGAKCIFFINNLLENKDPKNTLRTIWSISNEFHKLNRNVDKEDDELQKYKDRDVLLYKHMKNMQERGNEMRRSLIVSSNIVKQMDTEIIEMMSILSNEIMTKEYDKYQTIHQWFENHIEYIGGEEKVSSLEIWTQFKRINKEYIAENKITVDIFKEIIKRMIDSSKYIERSKKGSFDLIGFKIKQENISIEIVESVKKIKSIKPYFDKEKDADIIEQYNENDIIQISENVGIRPWEVVSVLVRNKIIQSRGEARGYDLYKKTDEYKNKLKMDCDELS